MHTHVHTHAYVHVYTDRKSKCMCVCVYVCVCVCVCVCVSATRKNNDQGPSFPLFDTAEAARLTLCTHDPLHIRRRIFV